MDESGADGTAIDGTTAVLTLARLGPSVLVALVSLAIAWTTLLPGVEFWDTGELQTVGPVMGTAHPTGFPTYVLLGWLASIVLQPFGEPAFRMNLFSAISIAVAAGVTVDLVRVLTGSRAFGVVVGLGLALTPIVLATGNRAETHSLHLALVAILLRLLVEWEARRSAADPRADRWLVAAAVTFAVSAGNHSLTLLLALPVGVYVLAVHPGIVRRPRLVLACAGALVATLVLVYLELPLRAGPLRAPLVYGRPETWDGFWYVVLAEQFRGSLVEPFAGLAWKVAALGDRTVREFGILAPFLPLALFVTAVRRPRFALLTALAVVVTTFFAASYQNAAIERYYLGPLLIAWTWLGVLAAVVAGGLARLGARWAATVRARPGASRLAATGLVAVLVLGPTLAELRERRDAVDARDDVVAARYLGVVLDAVAPNAVVISWWSMSTPLWYAQHVEGRRPDIEIIDDRTRLDRDLGSYEDVIDANLDLRPVYITRPDREWAALEEDYVIQRIVLPLPGHFGRVEARRSAQP